MASITEPQNFNKGNAKPTKSATYAQKPAEAETATESAIEPAEPETRMLRPTHDDDLHATNNA